ncbi:uncharacterized protein LOC131150463 [Malania oleifera]|uniref:uncharacterized protein LOC131150463 n=1 Tax=Malania oleifera TaxID=397392 RepID=UPI0025AEA6A4|nr:uncharacterized protein LOC131150463 [Malania oleifera]
MQVSSSKETLSAKGEDSNNSENAEKTEASECTLSLGNFTDDESVLDVSGKSLEFSSVVDTDESVEGLYVYKNAFNLIPRALGRLGRLRTLKFFANEINLFPAEYGNLVELERLQLKISSPGLTGGLPLHKLKDLKELELSKAPPRASALPILSDILGLKCLTKLSVCHFSIRFLPPEIGCLNNLEFLDLSFNKMKTLPIEISYLNALISLKVSNNKLVELPADLSSLQRLEHLDLSNNRLTSLGSFELASMHNLQNLNLQYNKLFSCCQIPSWIFCNLEGNGKDLSSEECSVEMDVFESSIEDIDGSLSSNASSHALSSQLNGSSSNSRCLTSRKLGKGWKRQYSLQQIARQERLNNSRKVKSEDHAEVLMRKVAEKCKQCKPAELASESLAEGAAGIMGVNNESKQLLSSEADSESLLNLVENGGSSSKEGLFAESCSCVVLPSVTTSEEDRNKCGECDASLASLSNKSSEQDDTSPSQVSKSTAKSKRHSDRDLDNPKPSKFQRPIEDNSNLSCKYSNLSFCGMDDRLPDGFYDAGRDRPFMSLRSYEQKLHRDSREVILVDRQNDEELDAIALSAQALVLRLKKLNGLTKEREQVAVDDLQIVSLLALFVSDHFGGSDRSAIVERTRKAVSGSNYQKPFVCTCPTGNSKKNRSSTRLNMDTAEDIVLRDLCESSLRSIKSRRNSIVVPIGTLHFGVCRHRALLMKYLCDRLEPPVPCELVRGYLDFLPHAWNVIPIKRGDIWVRMVVDACRPHDIREETDPEYFCRYVPLSRVNVPLKTWSGPSLDCSFPSLSTCDEIVKAASSSLVCCKIGSVEAAAKVRTLEVCGTSVDENKKFEYNCLGEIRILGALKKHSCIVEIFGHQISSKWAPSLDGDQEHRIIQSVILMEYIQGGSLKNHINELTKAGEKRLPVELALYIARDVACALFELHSKHIIHRDIKSENVLIDLERKRDDGTPIVKLCDFDRAVPLRSFLHTCCIAHMGIPPPDACVGTPRWMAPEVLRAMHKREIYGLEVDIWSFGCLLLELLTLEVPYSGLSESNIHDLLQMGERPPLTDELKALWSLEESEMAQSGLGQEAPEADLHTLRFLVDLFHRCTEGNPSDRPTAEGLYEMLSARASSFLSSRS